MTTQAMYRQGDIMLIRAQQPTDMSGFIHKDNILAYGEVTGHKHQFLDATAVQTYQNNNHQYCLITQEAVLSHEEHAPQSIAVGWYEVRQQHELNLLQEIRSVMD